jgi:hypothetical protein
MTLATRCDWCSRPFTTNAWNQRTCISCEVMGAPDQSKGEWKDYVKVGRAFRLAQAARPPRRSQLPHKRLPAPRTAG